MLLLFFTLCIILWHMLKSDFERMEREKRAKHMPVPKHHERLELTHGGIHKHVD